MILTVDFETGKESLCSSVDFQIALHLRSVEALQYDNTILSYLFKDAMEEDDKVVIVIFYDCHFFKKFLLPYFYH